MQLTLRMAAVAILLVAATELNASNSNAEPGMPSKVWWLDNPQQVSGAEVPEAYSVMQRGYFSMTLSLHTSGLTPGHNYSLWWVVFQTPFACVAGCGDDDINAVIATGSNPARIGVHYGGAFVAAESGSAELSARLLEDTTDACPKAAPYTPVCAPLRDSATAEALVFLIDHGPEAAGGAPINAFDTGCRRLMWFDYEVANYHQDGFDCYRAQSTFHRP